MSEERVQGVVDEHRAKYGRWGFFVPRWWFRPADRFNSSHWGLDWLWFHLWASGGPHLGAWAEFGPDLRIQVHLPCLHAAFILPVVSHNAWYGGPLYRKGTDE